MESSLVSALFLFRNNPERAEQTLQAVLPHAALFREIIIMDDGSSDLTPETIDSLTNAFSSDNVQFFRNAEPAGKGVCVNQLLNTITAPFLWMPTGVLDFDGTLFASVNRSHVQSAVLLSGPAASFTDTAQIVRECAAGTVFADGYFLFNLGQIPARELFVNPFLDEGLATEWAARILIRDVQIGAVLNEPFYVPDTDPKLHLTDYSTRQLAWSLWNATGDTALLPLLGIDQPAPPTETEADSTVQNIVDRIVALINNGNFQDAAWLVELIDEDDPIREELTVALSERFKAAEEEALEQEQFQAGSQPSESFSEDETFSSESDSQAGSENSDDQIQLTSVPIPEDLEFDERGVSDAPSANDESWSLKPVDRPATAQISLFDVAPEVVEPAHDVWKPAISVIIPTTIDGRRLLESCLISIEQFENPTRTELIVVNNASIDDTHEYLTQLAESGFFNLKVMHNQVNRGVAAAINQGISAASSDVIVFLHNDTELTSPIFGDLEHALNTNPEFGSVSVKTVPFGGEIPAFDSAYILHETNAPGSVCLAFRKSDGYRFDERYNLAWFEDSDFFMQIVRDGKLLGRLENRVLFHLEGTTTTEIGLFTTGDEFFRNKAAFNAKWDMEPRLPAHLVDASPINQLLAISEIINPFYPEPYLVDQVNTLISAETRTDILSGYWERENLFGFIRLMAATDHRDLLRSLEEKASSFLFYPELIFQLVNYYFNRAIYSRCKFYLDMLADDNYAVQAGIIRLSILLEDRQKIEAAELAQWLVNMAPVNADACALSARLNFESGEIELGRSFYETAHDMNPERHPMPPPFKTQ